VGRVLAARALAALKPARCEATAPMEATQHALDAGADTVLRQQHLELPCVRYVVAASCSVLRHVMEDVETLQRDARGRMAVRVPDAWDPAALGTVLDCLHGQARAEALGRDAALAALDMAVLLDAPALERALLDRLADLCGQAASAQDLRAFGGLVSCGRAAKRHRRAFLARLVRLQPFWDGVEEALGPVDLRSPAARDDCAALLVEVFHPALVLAALARRGGVSSLQDYAEHFHPRERQLYGALFDAAAARALRPRQPTDIFSRCDDLPQGAMLASTFQYQTSPWLSVLLRLPGRRAPRVVRLAPWLSVRAGEAEMEVSLRCGKIAPRQGGDEWSGRVQAKLMPYALSASGTRIASYAEAWHAGVSPRGETLVFSEASLAHGCKRRFAAALQAASHVRMDFFFSCHCAPDKLDDPF